LAGAIAGRECVLDLDAGEYVLWFYSVGSPTLYWVKAGYTPSVDRVAMEVPEGLGTDSIELRFRPRVTSTAQIALGLEGSVCSAVVDDEVLADVAVSQQGAALLDLGVTLKADSEHAVRLVFQPGTILKALRLR
jgi:hypothetical protein